MTVEVLPVGVACNLGFTYCYQNPMRDAGNFTDKESGLKVVDNLKKLGYETWFVSFHK